MVCFSFTCSIGCEIFEANGICRYIANDSYGYRGKEVSNYCNKLHFCLFYFYPKTYKLRLHNIAKWITKIELARCTAKSVHRKIFQKMTELYDISTASSHYMYISKIWSFYVPHNILCAIKPHIHTYNFCIVLHIGLFWLTIISMKSLLPSQSWLLTQI